MCTAPNECSRLNYNERTTPRKDDQQFELWYDEDSYHDML